MRSFSAIVFLSLFAFNLNPCWAQEPEQDPITQTARHGLASAQVFLSQEQERLNTLQTELSELRSTLEWMRGHRDRRVQMDATRSGLTAGVIILEHREEELQNAVERQQTFVDWANSTHTAFSNIIEAEPEEKGQHCSTLIQQLNRQLSWIDSRQEALRASLGTHLFFTSPSGDMPGWIQTEATRLQAELSQLEELERQLLPLRDDAIRIAELIAE